MKHGDISNRQSFVIGFRCDGCIVKYREHGLINHVLNLVKGKAHNGEIDSEVLSLMRHVFYQTDYSVAVVCGNDSYTDELRSFLEDRSVPYTEFMRIIKSDNEVTMKLLTGDLSYYVDSDYNRLSLINSQYAVSVEEFKTIFRRRRMNGFR